MQIPGTLWANLCPSLQVFGFNRKRQRAQGWADPRCSFTRPSSLNQNCWRPPGPVSGHGSRTCLWKFVPLPKHLSWKCWIPEPAPRITLDCGSPTRKHSLSLPAAQVFTNNLRTPTATPPKHKHGDRKQLADSVEQSINKPGSSALASSVCSQILSVLHYLACYPVPTTTLVSPSFYVLLQRCRKCQTSAAQVTREKLEKGVVVWGFFYFFFSYVSLILHLNK